MGTYAEGQTDRPTPVEPQAENTYAEGMPGAHHPVRPAEEGSYAEGMSDGDPNGPNAHTGDPAIDESAIPADQTVDVRDADEPVAQPGTGTMREPAPGDRGDTLPDDYVVPFADDEDAEDRRA